MVGIRTATESSLKPRVRACEMDSSFCLSRTLGLVAKIRKATSRLPDSGDKLNCTRTPNNSGQVSSEASQRDRCRLSGHWMGKHRLLSKYCRATSATASLILLRIARSGSDGNVWRSFWLMIEDCSRLNDMKRSEVSFVDVFRVLEAIFRKITAAKERI